MSINELIQQEKKLFDDKQLIKPWLQSKLTLRGINIVIERSDESKIVFKCKCSHHSSDKHDELSAYKRSRKELSSSHDDAVLERKKIRDLKKKFNCPFRIRANYSYRSKNWSLVVVNESHNHPLFPIASQAETSPLSSHINSPQQQLPMTNYNYNYSSRLPSLPTSNNNNNNNNSSHTHTQIQHPIPSPQIVQKNLNELQLEFNNNLLRLNCLNKEDDIRSIYIKLLKVLEQEQQPSSSTSSTASSSSSSTPSHHHQLHQPARVITSISSNFGSLFNSTQQQPSANATTNSSKTVLPSIQETLRYQHDDSDPLKAQPKINISNNSDNAFLRF